MQKVENLVDFFFTFFLLLSVTALQRLLFGTGNSSQRLPLCCTVHHFSISSVHSNLRPGGRELPVWKEDVGGGS